MYKLFISKYGVPTLYVFFMLIKDRPAYVISGTISRRPGYYLNNAYMLICNYYII